MVSVNILNLGLKSYSEALKIQNYFASRLKKNIGQNGAGTVLLVEHNPVYTIGIRTKEYTIKDEDKLKSLGAEFHKTNRGGLITFHGPGQMVAYPILNLKRFKPSIQWYISRLEKTVLDVCSVYGLEGYTSPHTGVWVNDRKVCAVGVHGSRYVTTHGLALNCNTDLSWFTHIVPCGIKHKSVTSLSQELHREITVEEVIPFFLKSFEETFDCSAVPLSSDEKSNFLTSFLEGKSRCK